MTYTITPEHYRDFDGWCRARNGLPYGYGGAFTKRLNAAGRAIDSNDCSALVLQSGAYLIGRQDWPGQRYGSTESFRLDYKIVYDLGFKRLPRGGAPIKPIMLVGLQHGGGGYYSHTACTVFGTDVPGGPIKQSTRGVDWESCGNGIFYYNRARAWNDPLFHDFWYLDAVLKLAPAVNEIDQEAKRATWLGARLTAGEKPTPDGGRFAQFADGYVYFHPTVRQDKPVGDRAIAVPKTVFEVWARQGWEAGPIGYPIDRHKTGADGAVVQAFQRGAIYRPVGSPGAVVHGAILDRYLRAGGASAWGYPITGETPTADGGREQKFSRATAWWHPTGVTVKEA